MVYHHLRPCCILYSCTESVEYRNNIFNFVEMAKRLIARHKFDEIFSPFGGRFVKRAFAPD